jgi:hypothetical protein
MLKNRLAAVDGSLQGLVSPSVTRSVVSHADHQRTSQSHRSFRQQCVSGWLECHFTGIQSCQKWLPVGAVPCRGLRDIFYISHVFDWLRSLGFSGSIFTEDQPQSIAPYISQPFLVSSELCLASDVMACAGRQKATSEHSYITHRRIGLNIQFWTVVLKPSAEGKNRPGWGTLIRWCSNMAHQ